MALSDKTKSGNIEFPNTNDDMLEMELWGPGDEEPRGTFAKSIGAWRRYRNDLNKARGNEKDYEKNTVYIFTDRPIGPQLKKILG